MSVPTTQEKKRSQITPSNLDWCQQLQEAYIRSPLSASQLAHEASKFLPDPTKRFSRAAIYDILINATRTNPTITNLNAIANALGLAVTLKPMRKDS